MGIYLRRKSWYFDFIHQGVRYAGAIGPVSKTVAKEEFARKKAAVVEGKLNPLRARRSPLFKDFAEELLNHKRTFLRPSSADRIFFALKPLRERFGSKRLQDVSAFEIERYRRDRKASGRTDVTVNRELQCLRDLFNRAIAWGKAWENPMQKVKLQREENARVRYLTEDEEEKLLEACGKSLHPVVVTALNTGLRRRELISLTWANMDFARGLVTVQAAYAKTGERRSIPMNAPVIKILNELKLKAGELPHVFLNSKGRPHTHQVSRTFEETAKRAKITDFHFHDLRHTFASRLIMNGVDLRTVQVLMGHKTINMTVRYAHLAPDHLKKAVESLNPGKSHNDFHNTPSLSRARKRANVLISKASRSGGTGRRAGLKIQ